MRAMILFAAAALLVSGAAHAEPGGGAVATGTAINGGEASYFSSEIAGQRTASGAICDPDTLTAAHRTLPFGSRVRVTNPDNGESVVVTINDRGPYARDRVIDLSRAAAEEIGLLRRGRGDVELTLLTTED
ncbi:septal ring lytic transglycosylase RlpA family protein [Stakelama saccharophila]|uniref:Endolytic peptidoglycan transglycosylase RlpA n=1 Tax=Stakelama saccharophila TaxID=3075605 RepID=A0ABZ0BA93_9SPHN|nr:septal ring lytic transglycosylase RlpA family protein [Stakelama sp. W311]WNO54184.1 septal ring lytic transglycosylase RlpA family protein [Stakelama sp. W311]